MLKLCCSTFTPPPSTIYTYNYWPWIKGEGHTLTDWPLCSFGGCLQEQCVVCVHTHTSRDICSVSGSNSPHQTKSRWPLEAFLMNRRPSWGDGLFPKFKNFLRPVPLWIELSEEKKTKNTTTHNELLSWIKRERQRSLCQSRMKKETVREKYLIIVIKVKPAPLLLLLWDLSNSLRLQTRGESKHDPYTHPPPLLEHTRLPVLVRVVSFVKLVHSLWPRLFIKHAGAYFSPFPVLVLLIGGYTLPNADILWSSSDHYVYLINLLNVIFLPTQKKCYK